MILTDAKVIHSSCLIRHNLGAPAFLFLLARHLLPSFFEYYFILSLLILDDQVFIVYLN